MSDEGIKPPGNTLAPEVKFNSKRMYVKLSGNCLKQDKVTFNHKKAVKIYIVYDLESNLNNFAPTLENCLFRAVKLTKNSDINKYRYSGYITGFDSKGTFTHPSGGTGVTGVANKKKNILILGRGPTKGLEHTLTAEKMYLVNFTAIRKKICLSLHYNGDNSYLFVNGTEITKFKAKDSERYQVHFV